MSIGPRTKPAQEWSSRVTVEQMNPTQARVSGCYDVAVIGGVWRERPLYGDLETEIEAAIRGVLERYAEDADD